MDAFQDLIELTGMIELQKIVHQPPDLTKTSLGRAFSAAWQLKYSIEQLNSHYVRSKTPQKKNDLLLQTHFCINLIVLSMFALCASKFRPILLTLELVGRCSDTSATNFELKSAPTNKLKILSLEDFINSRVQTHPKYLLENDPSKVFQYGTDPLSFRNEVFLYFKYGFWNQSQLGEEKLQNFLSRVEAEFSQSRQLLEQNPFDIQSQQRYTLSLAYQRQFSSCILPTCVPKMRIRQKYLQLLANYLGTPNALTSMEIHFILKNLQKFIFPQENEGYLSDSDEGWLLIQAFDSFLTKLQPHFHELSATQKTLLIAAAKTLRSSNLFFLQFIKKQLQKEKVEIKLTEFLSGLNLLSINKSFPYEFFYKSKSHLMFLIESAQHLSEKKVQASIAMLELFAREKLTFCQKIVHRLLVCIETNLPATDITQLTRIFYYYSRLKFTIKHEFVIKIVERVYLFMDILKEKDFCLIIKALANLNYQDKNLVSKLQQINYQLFLLNLKYGCQKLGTFYKAILDEIQANYQQDSKQPLTHQEHQSHQPTELTGGKNEEKYTTL